MGQLVGHWLLYRNVPVMHVRHVVELKHDTHGDVQVEQICKFCEYCMYIPVGH